MRLSFDRRIAVFDAALHAVRSYFRHQGLREVVTPVRRSEVAIEPYIEPIEASRKWLQTSPELAMKGLLARGSGPIYQIAPVFRRAEWGAMHREEFRLVEWYRLGAATEKVRRDVEGIVDAVFDAVADLLELRRRRVSWVTRGFGELVLETTGLRLRGDESAAELERVVTTFAPELWASSPVGEDMDRDVRDLAAWTAWFSQWSDRCLEPWLARDPNRRVHIVEFPIALAALSEIGPPIRERDRSLVAHRFESHVGGIELANGYRELRDVVEQRQRFACVAALRGALALPALPEPVQFFAELEDPGLPPCSGAAMGLERLVMLACGARELAAVLPDSLR